MLIERPGQISSPMQVADDLGTLRRFAVENQVVAHRDMSEPDREIVPSRTEAGIVGDLTASRIQPAKNTVGRIRIVGR